MQKFISDRPVVLATRAPFPAVSIERLTAEPSLFSNSPEGVRAQGGTFSKFALAHIEEHYAKEVKRAKEEGLSPIVDVRVQRLMPGMYPSIPGWHCDAVPRRNYDAQPDFRLINPAAFHVCVLLSTSAGGVSNTQFMDQRHNFSLWTDGPSGRVYQKLHEDIEDLKPSVIQVRDGDFVKFTPYTPHRAMPCHKRGVRMFFRYSMYHKPPIENGVAGQQQVYVLSEANGW